MWRLKADHRKARPQVYQLSRPAAPPLRVLVSRFSPQRHTTLTIVAKDGIATACPVGKRLLTRQGQSPVTRPVPERPSQKAATRRAEFSRGTTTAIRAEIDIAVRLTSPLSRLAKVLAKTRGGADYAKKKVGVPVRHPKNKDKKLSTQSTLGTAMLGSAPSYRGN